MTRAPGTSNQAGLPEPSAREDREAELESRWEAAPAVTVIIVLQVVLAIVSHRRGWTLWTLPWWWALTIVGPEILLLLALGWSRPRHRLEQMGRRRDVSLLLLGLVSIGTGSALVALIGSVITGHEQDGAELLFKGITIWATNVVTFGLWYWAMDQGGPIRRREPDPGPPDFQFPQLENPTLAEKNWEPRLFDYMYIAFTNAIAFSPTDAMPLTRRAKAVMLIESTASAITVLLVAARAVNILR
jgi:hypothetical protein